MSSFLFFGGHDAMDRLPCAETCDLRVSGSRSRSRSRLKLTEFLGSCISSYRRTQEMSRNDHAASSSSQRHATSLAKATKSNRYMVIDMDEQCRSSRSGKLSGILLRAFCSNERRREEKRREEKSREEQTVYCDKILETSGRERYRGWMASFGGLRAKAFHMRSGLALVASRGQERMSTTY